MNMSVCYLHHGGDGMNPVHVPYETLCQVGYAETDGPVGVAFQFDHLIGTKRCKTNKQTNKNMSKVSKIMKIHQD